MSFGKTGWEGTEPTDEGGGGEYEKYAPRRLWIPKPKEDGTQFTKRIMFVDTQPFCFHEHSLFKLTNSTKDRCICLAKNGMDERGCPVCDDERKLWAYYIGYFTIIDLGDVRYNTDGSVTLEGWRNKEGKLFQFTRKVLGAKRGGKDKPGMLQEYKRQMDRRGGSIVGCVFDVTRSGKLVETIGDKVDFVERVEPEKWEEYFKALGAEDCENDLELEPFDYMEVFNPHSYEQLQNLCGVKSQSGSGRRSEGANY